MAFEMEVQWLTQPGSIGNQTYNLARVTSPKAIILVANPRTANGASATGVGWNYCTGFATYRGSVVQQGYSGFVARDGQAVGDVSYAFNTDHACALLAVALGSATPDMTIDLVSMAGGGSPQVVLNWSNLFTTASIRVMMIVLGGSDITDAIVGSDTFGTGATTQDYTVTSGFGKPDFLFAIGGHATALGSSGTHIRYFFGMGKQGEAGRGFGFGDRDANTTMSNCAYQRSDRIILNVHCDAGTSTDIAKGQLDTTAANWPADGFRVIYDANPAAANKFIYLALRGTFQATTGANVAPTVGSPPLTQDNAAGFSPVGAILFGWNCPATTAVTDSDGNQLSWSLGAYDGTQEGAVSGTDDDAQGTSVAFVQQSDTRVWLAYDNDGTTINKDADGSWSGNNFRLTYQTRNGAVAEEYQWVIFGSGSAPPATPPAKQPLVAGSQAVMRAAVR